ncbi:hypothetical protein D9K79_10570 [Acinetobacter cumulans]|jgi:hypothetical protein|uniref:Uncharacterized protein n=1 Tax=Acinetobacter cumulans TaxID=2136182 RepID=A0A498CRG2_9GAMM|nr:MULTISPECIES: hypothetical protein [Acinetobacter]QCO22033.1 hypothetical protein C9E88_011340 [Acinetobacter cumulans]RFS34600.1 hypothetical protein DYI81_03620 [Acinetobacter sp. SWAC5]RKG45782.1 hypothetical protein D7V51_03820 [Acinetobacter cumulans]RLL28053.1 hypothetical protein D9K80_17965 [Acinetobacter cumulans]RLL44048.1 hypothetical protein D9K79_10570 [Acinetobacter cumulans]
MKYGVFSALIISVLWGILAIAQLWFSPLSSEIFTKVTISAGILVAIIVLSTIVIREFLTDQKLRKDGFID